MQHQLRAPCYCLPFALPVIRCIALKVFLDSTRSVLDSLMQHGSPALPHIEVPAHNQHKHCKWTRLQFKTVSSRAQWTLGSKNTMQGKGIGMQKHSLRCDFFFPFLLLNMVLGNDQQHPKNEWKWIKNFHRACTTPTWKVSLYILLSFQETSVLNT